MTRTTYILKVCSLHPAPIATPSGSEMGCGDWTFPYLGTYLTVLDDGDEVHFAEQKLLRETI